MRELIFEDLFVLSAIIDKMGIRADINKIFQEAQKQEEAQAYFGGQIVMMMIAKIHLAKKEVFEFLADISNLKVEEVRKMPIKEVIELLKKIFENNDVSSFFNSAAIENK